MSHRNAIARIFNVGLVSSAAQPSQIGRLVQKVECGCGGRGCGIAACDDDVKEDGANVAVGQVGLLHQHLHHTLQPESGRPFPSRTKPLAVGHHDQAQ